MEQIGRFQILRRLGGGGFGEVWLGHDDAIDRDVAIKVFKPKDENLIAFATSSDTEGLDILRTRFINETRIVGSLDSTPHVINILDFGELEDGAPYYVMPYLPLEHGEIPTGSRRELVALARIADLDEAGLDALVDDAVGSTALDKEDRQALYSAGDAIGWDGDKVDAVIAERGGRKQASSMKAPQASGEPRPAAADGAKQRRPGRVVAVVVLLLLATGGGDYWWNEHQQALAQERPAEARRTEQSRDERAAWDEATSLDSIEAYRAYLARSYTTAEHEATARERIEALEAAAERERQERLAAERAPSQPGETFKDCDVCPELVVIPAGEFRMGDLSGDGNDNEKPVHRVRIDEEFALGKTEVTFAEYDAFARSTGRDLPNDRGWGRGSRPVINVNWEDAQAYVKWLSEKTGKRYRLPSESEWEYAARAGSETKYHFGDSESALCRYANHADQSTDYSSRNEQCSDGVGKQTAPVGSFEANDFGLYDMHGNMWEWTQDCWNDSYSGAPSDGSAWERGNCERRVLRGGSCHNSPSYLRSANRDGHSASWRSHFVAGFRVAQDLE